MNKVLRYLKTVKEVLVRPFHFIAMSEQDRAPFMGATGFAAVTTGLMGFFSYLIAWIVSDPLFPPARAAAFSVATVYVQLFLFASLWMLFAVIVGKVRRRISTPIPFRRLLTALTYLMMGPFLFYMTLLGLAVLALVQFLEPHLVEIRESRPLALAVVGLLLMTSFSPMVFSGWLVTKAVKSFYKVGFLAGILLPATCWFVAASSVFFGIRTVDVASMSGYEQQAARRVIFLSEAQAFHWGQRSKWAEDFDVLRTLTLTPIVDDNHDYWNMIKPEIPEGNSKDGYRFRFLIYRGGHKCLVQALPENYGGETRLSFATNCQRFHGERATVFAEDALGGHATFFGRIVFQPTGFPVIP